MSVSRRDFVKNVSAGLSASVLFGTAAISSAVEPVALGSSANGVAFNHGVASGDPLQDRLIIWTRITVDSRSLSNRSGEVSVSWEVATDKAFQNIVRSGSTLTSPERDYTVKVDLVDLKPATKYFYRFVTPNVTSPIGVGKTLPLPGVEQVKLAVMSCSNYPAGYFNVYQEASLIPDLDAVCHLGDYIYEYGPGGFATELADQIGRSFLPGNDFEILKLDDYRARYAQYRTDPGCQNLHAAAPFICVWDDHEIANDAWREGAENHNPGEGEFSDRVMNALRAYYEWMPIRPPAGKFYSEEIFRRFDFGDLVSLHMLDTRIIGRDQQLSYADYLDINGTFDSAAFLADVTDPSRTILGQDQLNWLLSGLTTSPATWQVLGQQVLIGRMNIPIELLFSLSNPGPDIFVLIQELAEIKLRILAGDPTVTDQERARVETVAPYNLDAWDGYFFERETIFGATAAADKNLVTLAGDTHNGWANNLNTIDGVPVGVEFAASSVTSPGLEAFLEIPPPLVPAAEAAIQLLVDDLQYLNVADRGFMTVTFTQQEARADWTFIDNILDPNYQELTDRRRALKMLPGADGRTLVEV